VCGQPRTSQNSGGGAPYPPWPIQMPLEAIKHRATSLHDGDRLSERPVDELRGRHIRDREALPFDLQQRSCCRALPARTLVDRQLDRLHHRIHHSHNEATLLFHLYRLIHFLHVRTISRNEEFAICCTVIQQRPPRRHSWSIGNNSYRHRPRFKYHVWSDNLWQDY